MVPDMDTQAAWKALGAAMRDAATAVSPVGAEDGRRRRPPHAGTA